MTGDRDWIIQRLRELFAEAIPGERQEAAPEPVQRRDAEIVSIERAGRAWQFVIPGCELWRSGHHPAPRRGAR